MNLQFQLSESTKRRSSTSVYEDMAEKILCEFSAPSTENIRVGPELDTADYDYELKLSLINMLQATTFSGKKNEDASAHL
jgi:hypothetical protein